MLNILICFSRGRKLVYVGEPGLVSDGFVNFLSRPTLSTGVIETVAYPSNYPFIQFHVDFNLDWKFILHGLIKRMSYIGATKYNKMHCGSDLINVGSQIK